MTERIHLSSRVCISHTSGITPIIGGGIGSVISNVVNETKDQVDYTLVTTFNEKDLAEAGMVYGSGPRIVSLGTSSNIVTDFMRYLLKAPVEAFDIIHFHELPFGRSLPYALRLYTKGCNLVISHHYNLETTNYFPMNHRMGKGYYHFFFKRSYKIWKRIIVNSKYMLGDLARYSNCTSKAVVIPNGVNPREFQVESATALQGDPAFLFIGHLEWHKGLDILLRAFSDLLKIQGCQKAHLHLVGSGSMEARCREIVFEKKLEEKVHFWGSQSRRFIPSLLKGCDIFILPSRHEASPIVLLEAMAAGKPIVSTNVGGIPETLKNGRNALLVRPEHTELVRAMNCLTENADLKRRFSNNNIVDVQMFSWSNISKEYVRLYKSVAGSG
jgi:glycosyltransferase involved in cell wall biosynthesis